VQAWRELLEKFSSLDRVHNHIDYPAALRELKRQSYERVFQPKSPETPVQVLGVLETSGLVFDQAWVMGLHDGIWPPAPRPNPFLPLKLQWQRNVPHASPARELEVSRHITEQLLASADNVIFSYPRLEGEEELRPSPLLQNIPETSLEQIPFSPQASWKELIHAQQASEIVEQDDAPPVQGMVKGGSRIFTLQSACPFRAFAELRLQATLADEASPGLNAMERGTLMHSVLEYFWRDVVSLENLQGLEAAARKEKIARAVWRAISEKVEEYPQVFTERFCKMEQARLERLVESWLEQEESRQPFRVVAWEERLGKTIGNITFNLQIDRIDELEDGRKVLVDYKTGEVTASGWFGERPDDPQLPLYSTLLDNLAGITFAQLKTGKMGYKGIAQEEGLVGNVASYKKVKQLRDFESWEDVLHEWDVSIEGLAKEFSEGVARVSPKKPSTCQFCKLSSLCRIGEQESEEEAMEVEE
jgi:probable DNA repair protein